MVCAQVEEVVGRVGPHPVGFVVVRERGLGDVIPNHVRQISMGHGIDERRLVVDTEVGLQREALDGLDFYVAVAEDAPVVEMVFAVVILLTCGVLTVGHGANGACEGLSVDFIHRHHRWHLEGVLHGGAVYL